MALVNIPDRVQTKYEHVRNALLQHISESGLEPGDRLPSERQLAELTGINRLTVRRAIKSLCEDEILRQVPKTGTFVKQIPEPASAPPTPDDTPNIEDSLTAEGSFFQTTAKSVLRFHIEDIHSPQQKAWTEILEAFEQRHQGIRIQPCFESCGALLKHPEQYDIGLCIPRYLKRLDDKGRLFPQGFAPGWFNDYPLNDELRTCRDLLVRAAKGKTDSSLPGVPIMYNLDILFYNRKLVAAPLPDHASLAEIIAWVEASPDGPTLSPFTQATLNALLRSDRRILRDEVALHLDNPSCHDWIDTQKRLLELQPALSRMSTSDIINGFLKGSVAACDLHTNALCTMASRFAPGLRNLGATLCPLAPEGCTQIMPRYLAILGNGSPHALALANFLAGPWAQRKLAQHHLGLPMYLEDGVDTFCADAPLTPAQVHQELSRLGGAYEHALFISGFQANMLNPLLRLHIDGSISRQELIHQLDQLPTTWLE